MRILITGISGVGKTTTLAELQKQGHLVIDLDETGLCQWKNIQTGEVTEYGLNGKDYQWLAQHGWYCDIEKFKVLLSCIRQDKLVFVAGLTENFKEFLVLFDRVFLLDTDEQIVTKRLIERTNNHFAKKEDERSFIFKHSRELLGQIKDPVHIDTHHSPDVVAQSILDDLNIKYTQNNPKLWFKAKRYGFGWTPSSWQGWGILLMYLFAILSNTIFVDNHSNSVSDFFMQFFSQLFILTVFLIIICYKTGEKPRWRWGKE